MSDHFAQLALTRYAAPDERLRLALADHALGRMTADAWAELVQELMAGLRDELVPDGDGDAHRYCYSESDVHDIEAEKEEVEEERDAAQESLAAVFEWLRANPKASCADAVEHLSEHDPE